MNLINKDKWNKFIGDLNKYGIPLPMARDPKNGLGSMTATSYWISFNFCLICGVFFIALAIGKFTGLFTAEQEAVDAIKNASQYALELFITCAGIYLGRKMQRDKNGDITVEGKADKKDEN